MSERNPLERTIKSLSNIHRSGNEPNVFLFSTPRSGSTWLMELIWTQPGFKHCNEPLNLRNPLVVKELGIAKWEDLGNEHTALPFLEKYISGYCQGRIRFKNPNPFSRYYRPLTRRIVFKVIHGGEAHINWFRDTFDGRILYLLRHPIPVSLSRRVLPRLYPFLQSEYRRYFTSEQIDYAERVVASGDHFDQAIVDWCFQNKVPLQQQTEDWAMITYEQMVVDPQPVVNCLAQKLGLPCPSRMMERLTIPSAVTAQSNEQTQAFMKDTAGRQGRDWLIDKWKTQVTSAQMGKAAEALSIFEIDVYRVDSSLPVDKFWIRLDD